MIIDLSTLPAHERMRLIRVWKGLSTDRMCKLSGISHSAYSRMENGWRTNITDGEKARIAKTLAVSVDDIFG